MKRRAYFIILFFFISVGSFAQKERFVYQPRFLQTSIRAGLVNGSLNLEYPLNLKIIASIDLGIGIVHMHSYYYNRFNENYDEYDKNFGKFLNFYREWWSPLTSIQIKRAISSSSHIKYESSPYANTFTYYGFQLKYNGQELKGWINNDPLARFKETYQFSALFGRQVELGKDSNFLCDVYLGVGGIFNYKFSAVEAKFLIGSRIGFGLWRQDK